jgi:acetylornithine deacetylase/succinyl-diaminopimelate desuccinylase-like protein
LGFAWRIDNQGTLQVSEVRQPEQIIPKPIVQEMIGQVNQERTLADLRRLTGEEPVCTSNGCYTITGRETGSIGLKWAKDYVYETLSDLHYSVEILNWSKDGYDDQNILAYKPGILYPNEAIYFIAHMDGYGRKNPAADDDASGVVSLLELARVLSGRTLSRPVVLFFLTGEEQGALGSDSFIEQFPGRLDSIKYLISVEMLGWDSNNDGKMQLWSGDTVLYPSSLEFTQLLSEIITAYPLNLIPQIVTGCD